jgi:hypothetical protein
MYITNIQHLLNASEKMSEEMPKEARELIGFLTLIIDTTTKNLPQTLTTTDVRCFQKGCRGLIKSALRPDTGEIHWYCPDCENEGVISEWQKTKWDNRVGKI